MLTAKTTPTDDRRVTRLLLAWLDGDKLALDVVLDEAVSDPVGTPGLLFSLTHYAARLSEQVAPDVRDQLRATLLADHDTGLDPHDQDPA